MAKSGIEEFAWENGSVAAIFRGLMTYEELFEPPLLMLELSAIC